MNIEALEKDGWTVVCESPLKISHDDGSLATGQAAKILIDAYGCNVTPEVTEQELREEYELTVASIKENLENYKWSVVLGNKRMSMAHKYNMDLEELNKIILIKTV
jgi:hypothetical protein